MSKTYILQKDLPFAKAGAIYTQENAAREYYNTDGNYYYNRLYKEVVEQNPDWFLFLPEENKSNDSFQWDDGYVELILQAATGNIKDFVMNPKEFIHDFKENWKSKPQAENKPDWEIVKYEFLPLSESIRPFWIDKNSVHWEKAKTDSEFRIFSVKRLSDGGVFSVGDYVNDCKYPIAGFNICDDGKRMYVYGEKNSWGQDLPKINKSFPPQPQKEEPLFTTEDGVIVKDPERMIFYISDMRIRERKAKNAVDLRNKRFYEKEKAEQYVLMNKKCFSVNEIIETLDLFPAEEDRVIVLAKQKQTHQ